jgi:spermidine synthase
VVARLSAGSGGVSVNAIRLLTAFLVMLVPATAMGATLPVLAGALVQARGQFASIVARLYRWNTLGAVVGVVLADTVLVARVGIAGSAWVAAALDLLAAALALRFATQRRQPAASPLYADTGGDMRAALPILIAAFFAGAALLALEVVWLRFLSMYVLTTTLAMSLMLAVVLAAIGVGGIAGSGWRAAAPTRRRGRPRWRFSPAAQRSRRTGPFNGPRRASRLRNGGGCCGWPRRWRLRRRFCPVSSSRCWRHD